MVSTRSYLEPMVVAMACGLRTVVRRLSTRKDRVSLAEKVLRAALLVPVFAALSLVLRPMTGWAGPWRCRDTPASARC